METGDRLKLSFYKEIETLSAAHRIYLVRHQQTNAICVKKVLEVYHLQVYRQLMQHPVANTPRILELFEDAETLTVIEEYIPGNSLDVLLEKRGPVPAGKAYKYMTALCDILSDLHTLEPPVIHRDIKPSNIIITPDDRFVLLDFNAARNYCSDKTEDTEFLGTRGYAAPEQYGFGESSERTDIYAAGVLFRTMLTGSEDVQADVGGKAGKIIAACMKMDPSERYPSAKSLKRALQRASAEVPSNEEPKTWKRFLPPGFRAGKPGYIIGMSLLYAVLIAMTFTSEFTNCPPGFLWFERACFGIALVMIVLFSGNYLNMQGRLMCLTGQYIVLRVFLVILIDIAIFFSAALFSGIVELLMGAGGM